MNEQAFRKQTGSPLSIVHLVLSLDTGGAEVLLVAMAKAQKAAGHQVEVICIDHPGVLAEELEQADVPVRCLNRRPGIFDFDSFHKLGNILNEARDYPLVLHSHNFEAGFYGALGARSAKVPVLHMQHGMPVPWNIKSWLRSRIMRYLIPFNAGVSDSVTERCRKLGWFIPEKSKTVLNGVDTGYFDPYSAEVQEQRASQRQQLGLEDDALLFVCVARMADVKDHATLVNGFASYLEKGGDSKARLALVGDGPCRSMLERLVGQYGLQEQVFFPGETREVRPWLAAADYFVLNSKSEGISVSIMEAMAMAVIPVVTNVGGNPLLVTDGSEGILFPSGSAQETCAALQRASSLPASARQASREKIIRFFSQERMHADYEALYRKLLSNGTK